MYNYGARKVVVIGLGQIGCSPNELAQNSQDGITCVEKINSACQIFNFKLKGLVTQLNNELPDARFIYINAYKIFQDIATNPANYGKVFQHLQIYTYSCSSDLCFSISVDAFRFQGVKCWVLWSWQKPRANHLPAISNSMPEPK